MVWSTHSVHYVIEEKLAVSRNHHDLQFVGEALGNDFINQQWILLQNRGLARHTIGVGGGGQTNALGVGLREKFTAIPLSFAVDEFSFAGSLGILHRGFLARLSFEFRLLNLFLLQRECVLHGIGLAFRLQHSHSSLSLSLFHFLHLGSFGVGLGDFYLLLVSLGFHAHAGILLFLHQQRLQALGILLRKLDVTQRDFLHHDAVGGEALANHFVGTLTDLFPLSRADFP